MYNGQRGKLVENFNKSNFQLLVNLMKTAKRKFSSGNGDGVYFGLEKNCIYPARSGPNSLTPVGPTTVSECDGTDKYPSVCEFSDTPCNPCLKDLVLKRPANVNK